MEFIKIEEYKKLYCIRDGEKGKGSSAAHFNPLLRFKKLKFSGN